LPDSGALGRPARQALRSRPHARWPGDFSLNAANSITAAELLALGLDSLTPTHDLNAAQVADLARAAGAQPHRNGGVPPLAGLPHRALRVLPFLSDRIELPGLRPALRRAPSGAARFEPAARIP
jgi:hypothetical protein